MWQKDAALYKCVSTMLFNEKEQEKKKSWLEFDQSLRPILAQYISESALTGMLADK